MSYLYAVQMLIPDYVQPIKIGFSVEPAVRVQTYRSGPFPVQWLGSWPVDERSAEKNVHFRFDRYRMLGEWFFPAPAIMDFINTQLKKPGAIPAKRPTDLDEEIALAQRWNLSRLAAIEAKHVDWTDNAVWISSVFDRSAVSHEGSGRFRKRAPSTMNVRSKANDF